MEYGKILERAINVTWKKKVLWIFGILAALFSGSSGGSSSNVGNTLQYRLNDSDIPGLERFFRGMPWGSGMWDYDMQRMFSVVLMLLGIALIVGLVLTVLRIIVRYTSLGALIGLVDRNEREETTRFRDGLRIGWRRFLRLFTINLIIWLVTAILIFILIVILFMIGAALELPAILAFLAGNGFIAMGVFWTIAVVLFFILLLILVMVLVTLVVTPISEYSVRVCVIENAGVFGAISGGVRLFRQNLRESALMWLILALINLAVGVLFIPVILLEVGIAVVPAVLLGVATKAIWLAILVAIPLLLVVFLLNLWLGGLYLTFQSAVWTLTYRELRKSTEL